MKRVFFLVSLVFGVFTMLETKGEETRLLRFPSIHENVIIFSYAGDLYSVDATGGTARKLTSHVGYEMFARISPNGQTIAFTGQYDGNTEIYKMPIDGGMPVRLTYTATLDRDLISDRMGPNNIVMAWTPDGQQITYRSRKHSFNSFRGALYNVPVSGGLSDELPFVNGGFCSYSADGKKIAFNRVFREFRTWKYYKGGMADDVWIFDFDSKEIKNITNHQSQDIFPMWMGDHIYFISDRDRTMNMFKYNLNTEAIEKVTDFTEYDIKFPSAGGRYIVFENAGYIYKLDTRTDEMEKVTIEIKNDFIWARDERKDASEKIRDADASPKGKRVVFSARGEIFSVPAEKGITFNLTHSPGVHDRDAVWSPDGKYIAYISDKTGEFEVYMVKSDGSEPAVQLTKDADTYYYQIKWSPDSKKLLWSDRKLRLRYVDIDSKKITEVAKAERLWITSYAWSPDSRWITYTTLADNDFSVIHIYGLVDREARQVTNKWYSSQSPTFSADGKYLTFTSNRDFNPIYSDTEWNHAYDDMERIYLLTLQESTVSPLAPENTEVETEESEKDEEEKNKKDSDEADNNISIDFEGITDRIIDLPIGASSYASPYTIDDKVYYMEMDDGVKAKMYDLEEQKETALGSFRFSINPEHKKMLVRAGSQKYAVIDLPSSSVNISETIDISDMMVEVDYEQEWQQIYDESWRQMRDFFYVENMHGLNWDAIYDKYNVLVPYARHRDDLTYIIGEMIGELNVGHAYVQSGDRPEVEKIKTGLLGAKLSKHSSGYFRIDEILPGVNWDKTIRSPLQLVGKDIKEGQYILAINGIQTNTTDNIYRLLTGRANQKVELTIGNSPDFNDTFKAVVVPTASESQLYYYRWVQNNIKKVSEATNGQVGYIHIPDMGRGGLNEFAKYFYPQLDKKALIIDDRGNGGGNVSPMIIERLQREVYRASMMRNVEVGRPVPRQTMMGPKVLLVDGYSASDGDLFPYAFKQLDLGTVIGTRTWGGVVGITRSLPFIDGAELRKPEFASYSHEKSEYIIEGYGVDPDIVIDNNPYEEYKGKDAQLQKAIEVILDQLDAYEPLPEVPEGPDKTK